MPSVGLHMLWTVLIGPSLTAGVVLTNMTIDDADRSIAYHPSSWWSEGGFGQWDVDTTRLFDGTWHQAVSQPDDSGFAIVEVQFTGVAVYVYNVVIDPTTIRFTVDHGSPAFYHGGGSGHQYNVLVYSNHSMENTLHKLTMVLDNDGQSEFFLDRVVFTAQSEDSNPQPSSSHSTSLIIVTPPTTSSEAKPTSSSQGSLSSSHILSSSSLGLPPPSSPSSTPSQSVSQTSVPSPNTSSQTRPISSTQPSTSAAGSAPSETQPATPHNKHVDIIVSGVVGGAIAALLVLLLWAVLCKRRARKSPVQSQKPLPLIPESSDASEASFSRVHSRCQSKDYFTLASQTSSWYEESVDMRTPTPSRPSAVYDGPTDTHVSSVVFSPRSSRGAPPSTTPSTSSSVRDERESAQQGAPRAELRVSAHEAVENEGEDDDGAASGQVQAQLLALGLELRQLRRKQLEMHSVLLDAPPRYEEA